MQLDLFAFEPPAEAGRNIRAISLWEPWATAMALGLKANETRGWSTGYRGDLVICAAQRRMQEGDLRVFNEWILPTAGVDYVVPYGHAVAIVEVFDCRRTEELMLGQKVSRLEFELGNYDFGRWAWMTRNVRRLSRPVPIKGKQGFFSVPEGIILAELDQRGKEAHG